MGGVIVPLARDEVREMLREIVAEFPDGYKYTKVMHQGLVTCVYAVDGCPSCLIGHLLDRLNVVVPLHHQSMPIHFVAQRHAPGLFSAEAVTYLSNVQSYQDNGLPWLDCLLIADANETFFNRLADVAPQATV